MYLLPACDKRICLSALYGHVGELFLSLIFGLSQYLKATFERSHARVFNVVYWTPDCGPSWNQHPAGINCNSLPGQPGHASEPPLSAFDTVSGPKPPLLIWS
jgi:hypothetical protein